ncbi:fimbria/pilus periplasmic chaperone [Jeongeupia sp. USM3]|uniref:fimbria/pilus periplasmic chaperone n=1 Tax=Jeongeupia sp. USM3 TaxID=1906741 RepID=UPI00196A49F0|nr:fimbria/pilus periplasmic chaperone [Jeongeupia sp. USM3]
MLLVPAQAAIVISNTRAIFNGADSEVTVKLQNAGERPVLIQSWLDKGDPKAEPGAVDVPFIVTPPIARVDPNGGQVLRIVRAEETLPQDRESVFWLNVLEVPPKADKPDVNTLQLVVRTRIKMFYRPEGLAGNVKDAPGQLQWHVKTEGSKQMLSINNPGLYHVSIVDAKLVSGGKDMPLDEVGMIAPGETREVELKAGVANGGGAKVEFGSINDYGGTDANEAELK